MVRLFDAGADKPLPWLGGGSDSSRGIQRLLAYPEVFAAQMRALARAREHADVRVLLPFVRTTDDVNAVRKWAAPTLRVGAMIESPDAVEEAESIAAAADFVSIGTNDLTATTLGLERTSSVPGNHPKVLALVRRTVSAIHARGRGRRSAAKWPATIAELEWPSASGSTYSVSHLLGWQSSEGHSAGAPPRAAVPSRRRRWKAVQGLHRIDEHWRPPWYA